MRIIILLFMAFPLQPVLFSQIVDKPTYEYEYLCWRQHVNTVKQRLSNKQLIKSDQSNSQFIKKPKEETFQLTYIDTIYAEVVAVGLNFTAKDSLLSVLVVTYLGIDPNTKKQYDNIDDRLDTLSSKFTARYGVPLKEKSILFLGQFKNWETTHSNIQMLKLTSASALIIHFTPRES